MNRIEFTLDLMSADDAVQDDPTAELRRILLEVAEKLKPNDWFMLAPNKIYDLNGNAIGSWSYVLEDDDGE